MNYPKPTASELEILQVLWEQGPSNVRLVNDILNSRGKNIGYTTTLKMMQIMTGKGLLSREMNGRTHIYSSALHANVTRNALIENMARSLFGGSAMKLVLQALGNQQATPEELKEIKALIAKLEKEQKTR